MFGVSERVGVSVERTGKDGNSVAVEFPSPVGLPKCLNPALHRGRPESPGTRCRSSVRDGTPSRRQPACSWLVRWARRPCRLPKRVRRTSPMENLRRRRRRLDRHRSQWRGQRCPSPPRQRRRFRAAVCWQPPPDCYRWRPRHERQPT